MELPAAIAAMIERRHLSREEMRAVMQRVMTGEATPAQIGGLLIGLRMKGETVQEIVAAAEVMRALATQVEVADRTHLVDTCGTGGDGLSTFNISTTSAFVVAAAGGRVAKHGNRSVSSKSGSADILEAAGVNLELTPAQVARCIDETGVGFLFAPKHHNAMKHAIGPRREMGVRTIFNILGPLTNPAAAPHQLLGVYQRELTEPLAQVLQTLGSRHVMVVHADDGLDEISIHSATQISELRDGAIRTYRVSPEDFGLRRAPLEGLRVSNASESVAIMRAVLGNAPGAARDIVALNAGAAIYVAGLAHDFAAGVATAHRVIASGDAAQKLEALIRCSQAMK